MKLIPRFNTYYKYSSDNYGAHALVFETSQGSFYFSYKTLVAFETPKTGRVCLKNYWSNTTGKHLNAIEPDHKARVDQETFDRLLEEATA